MLILVVDTSTPAITAALAEIGTDVRILAARQTVNARAHGELLGPHIDAVLREAGVRPGDLTAVVAGTGPGPFTGLRVGLVTATTFGQALDVPTYGVCSLDALGEAAGPGRAAGPGEADGPGAVLVATDARRHEVYWAVYSGGRRLAGPAVDRPAAVRPPVPVTAAVGDGALRYTDALRDAGVLRDAAGADVPVRDEPRYPPAAALARLAVDRVRAGAPTQRLVPLYLRRPDVAEPERRKAVLP